ncbi:hypothetical protein ACSVDA_24115 [Cytobacillus sp. Hm23]
MKIIVNNYTNLVVEDEEGNVLFQWLPKKEENVEKVINKCFKVNPNEALHKKLEEGFKVMGVPANYFTTK